MGSNRLLAQATGRLIVRKIPASVAKIVLARKRVVVQRLGLSLRVAGWLGLVSAWLSRVVDRIGIAARVENDVWVDFVIEGES